jgi:hypothetical protein
MTCTSNGGLAAKIGDPVKGRRGETQMKRIDKISIKKFLNIIP